MKKENREQAKFLFNCLLDKLNEEGGGYLETLYLALENLDLFGEVLAEYDSTFNKGLDINNTEDISVFLLEEEFKANSFKLQGNYLYLSGVNKLISNYEPITITITSRRETHKVVGKIEKCKPVKGGYNYRFILDR
ncbi:hypothetical protein H6G33_10675 [Calothrix sp. FACHB-1219]|uniref:hypothetical protein n=1 Tax=unclassified Calothrix TaxID=2619626 RepID=UPI0016891DAB|nr:MULTISPECIES: hypothetical protein [unclassified Calothrix]MBD2201812.1 hypothetical protein [Calothrix sp. FACHB-168]MBD2217498.1 hypothetical protein [Calothrix sp. FACHB-1219]